MDTEIMILFLFIGHTFLSVGVAYLGSKRTIGPVAAFIWAFLLSPLAGILIVLCYPLNTFDAWLRLQAPEVYQMVEAAKAFEYEVQPVNRQGETLTPQQVRKKIICFLIAVFLGALCILVFAFSSQLLISMS